MANGASVVDRIQARAVAGGWCQPPAQVLMHNCFDRTTSSVLLFLFSRGARSPDVVVKLCRNVGVVKREFDTLHLLRGQAAGLAPEPLFFENVEGFGALGMRALAGRSLGTWEERMACLPGVVGWLIGFQRATTLDPLEPGDALAQYSAPFEQLVRLGRDPSSAGELARMGALAKAAISGASLPRIPQHGDFYFGNILVQGDRIGVVDWEDFGTSVLPGYDLFTLLLHEVAGQDGPGRVSGNPEDPLARRIRGATRTYFEAFGVAPAVARAILLYTLAQQFIHSATLGRSSQEMLWRRVEAYVGDRGRFVVFLDG